MKKLLFVTTFIFVFSFVLPTFSSAQGMMNNIANVNNAITQSNDSLPADLSVRALASAEASAQAGHTAREEAEGKAVWEKLQAKEVACEDLTDDNFGTLGEYFMGQMLGDAHEAMNNMMIRMMGEKGEEQIHIVMGKRLSGCDTSAAFPSQGVGFTPTPKSLVWGFMPMMNMMWGGWSSPSGLNQSGNSMMNFGFTPFGGFGWIFMIVWWVLIIFGIVALIKWLMARSRNEKKSPLEILQERYAKGEIDKKEFEEKKKDLTN